MNPRTSLSTWEANEEVSALIATLHETGQRLEELTAGEVDTVADSAGRTFVLRHAQEQLRHIDDARQAAILNTLPAHIALISAQGIIVSANDPWRRFPSGEAAHGPGHAIGLNYLEICEAAGDAGSSEALQVAEGIRSVLRGEEKGFSIEYPCHSPTEQRWFLLTVTPLAEDRLNGAVVMHLNITEKTHAERRLLESEEEYRLLFDSNPHPMWVYDVETLAFLAVNDAAVRLYGFSRDEFLAMTIKEIRPPDDVPALLEYLSALPGPASVPVAQVRHRKKDGCFLEVAAFSNPIEFRGKQARLVMANDVTDKKRLESQLLQAQKMEAVGRLAGGVAHDFNNSLGVILGYTEMLMRQASEAQKPKLDQILKATKRATGLTRQLLAFSRKQVVDPKVLDLNALLSDLEPMLARLIGEDVDLVLVPGTDLGEVKVDPGQLEQVVINLCVNARDAMPDGGSLRIETANVDLAAGQAAQLETIAAGRYVMVAVSDAGCGIDKAILATIFEPFFTTKEEGKGTGLGLAMVYGTVKQAGGYVWVYSEVGQGTTFKIYLPRIDEALTPVVTESAVPMCGSETILLVEDEVALREIAREILEAHGYRVIEACGGKDALEMAHGEANPIHLLVTDVVMPGMNGRVLAESLIATHPRLKVLYMSGYTDDVIAHRGVLDSGTLLLEKPFTAAALLGRVRDALGERTH